MTTRLTIALAALAALTTLSGCGGGHETTVARTVTVPARSTPSAPTTAAPTTPSPTTQRLPHGRPDVHGSYKMVFSDYSPATLNVAGEPQGQESHWLANTTCDGSACQVDLRRKLNSGGYKRYTLRAVDQRKYVGVSTGTSSVFSGETCGEPSNRPHPAKQRLSIRVTGVATNGAQPLATRLVAYLVSSSRCPAHGEVLRGVGVWRGSLVPN